MNWRKIMSDTSPQDMHTITPHIICDGAAEAIEFYKKAFGATELMRLAAPHGKIIHAAIRIGDSMVMLMDEMEDCGGAISPKGLKGTPVSLHMMVENVDAAFKKALDAGATSSMEPQDMFWGDRYGVVIDPFGHKWSVAQRLHNLTPEEIEEAAYKEFS
jgi:uncharacterized glyoxalase superfamily protein PhnB